MLSVQGRLQVNDSEVAAKMIDGEAIIINLASGMYYSLDKTGAVVWSHLAAGYTVDEVVDIVARHFGADRQQVNTDVCQLTGDLREQRLLVEADRTAPVQEIKIETNGDAYETPTLNAYSDMGEILALDPPLPQLEEPPSS